MAGMLPGVECARRRRFPQKGRWMKPPESLVGNGRTRHSSYCLYTSSHGTYLSSSSFLQRNTLIHGGDKLNEAAREAKKRLDERLRNQCNKPQYQRAAGKYWCVRAVFHALQRLVFGLRKRNNKRKCDDEKPRREQGNLAVFLKALEGHDQCPPCGQGLHSWCLVSWLESTADFSFNKRY